MQQAASNETQKQNEIGNDILHNANISIMINVLLLVSTILASDFFGIVEFVECRSDKSINGYKLPNTTSINKVSNVFLKILFALVYFVIFFFMQLYYSFMYFGSLFKLRKPKEHAKEKNALKSLVSIAIAACWCLGIYQGVIKRQTAYDILELNSESKTFDKDLKEAVETTASLQI